MEEKKFNLEEEVMTNKRRRSLIKTDATCRKNRKERNRKRKAKRRAKY